MNPLFSVIVPCYNYGRYLAETLSSVSHQKYQNWECIVVDDGSTDDTKDIAESFVNRDNRFIYVYRQNGGLCSARNTGQQHSKGDYFIFLDSDDLLTDQALEWYSHKIASDQSDIIAGNWSDFFQDGREEDASTAFFFPDDPIASLLKSRFVVSAVTIKRNDRIWNTSAMPFEVSDYFNFFLFQGGIKVSHVDGTVTKIRQHQTAERLSLKLNHFEPYRAGNLHKGFKGQLSVNKQLNDNRESVLDYYLFQYAVALLRMKEITTSSELLTAVNRKKMNSYYWFKMSGISGFYLVGGLLGLRLFLFINKLLGR